MELIETLNRTMKLAMDEGRVGSYGEAQSLFRSFRLSIHVRPGFSTSPADEAAVLTLLNAAPKTFLGGVEVVGPLRERCTMAWFVGKTLGQVAEQFGVTTASAASNDVPIISVGDGVAKVCEFWLGVSTYDDGFVLSPDSATAGGRENTVEAGVAAAGAALNEAFQYAYRKSPFAGQREVRWKFPSGTNQTKCSGLWLIGLGHLGQAFLWSLALAGGNRLPRFMRLTDYDTVSWSSMSTCLLVEAKHVGKKKVDVVAEQLETIGVRVQRDYDRLSLDASDVQSEQEQVVVAVDNIALRRSLDRLHAKRVLEAGIGGGADAFTRMQLHAFPGPRRARDIWVGEDNQAVRTTDVSEPAYQALLANSGDQCGTALVAGLSVATPFVGAFAGALASKLVNSADSGTYAWSVDVANL